jgi:hypothetical protein
VYGVLTAISRLAGCTPAVVEDQKWTLIAKNTADTKRNLHQLLKGKQLYSVLYGVYTEVLYDLTAVLEESTTEEETAETTFTGPPSIEKLREQRR